MLAFPDTLFGRARYLDSDPSLPSETARIYLKVDAPDLGTPFLAQLDTGAAWTILDPQLADALGVNVLEGELVQLSTRFGEFKGHLARTTLRFLADEGDSLDIEATVFVSREWPTGRNFIAYSCTLERIRFAVDAGKNWIYYGVLD